MYENRRIYEDYISSHDVRTIHDCTLRVLREVGVSFPVPEALKLFKQHGATVEGDIVKISEKMLDEALETVPRSFTVTTGKSSVSIGEKYRPKTAPALGPPTVLTEDGVYREATVEDVIKFIKLEHTSDVVDFITNVSYDTVGIDKSLPNFYLPQMALCLKYSDKPTYGNVVNSLNVKDKPLKAAAKEIAQIYKEFYDIWDKPVLLTNCCAMSPLGYSHEVLENIMGLVEEGQPVTILTMSMTNFTAPASLMGTLIVDNATVLAGIVLTQLINPGVPVIYGCVSAPTAMKELTPATGGPESQLIYMAVLAMGRYYGLPVRTGPATTDALQPDYQAGLETGVTLYTTYAGKADFVSNCVGNLQSYLVASFEKFILDEEVNRYWARVNRGIDISEQKGHEMVDQIKKIGPLGNYLVGRTPKEYRKEHYLTKIFNRENSGAQIVLDEQGTLHDKAARAIKKRLEEYQEPELEKRQKKILNRYLPDAEQYKEV